MGKTSEHQSDGTLSGRYFINITGNDELDQGWVLKEVNAGLFLVETFVRVDGKPEKILKVVHPIEMKGWVFFESLEQAQRYCDQKVIETLPDIDFTLIMRRAQDEFEDMALEQLSKAREKGQGSRVKELVWLLKRSGS